MSTSSFTVSTRGIDGDRDIHFFRSLKDARAFVAWCKANGSVVLHLCNAINGKEHKI